MVIKHHSLYVVRLLMVGIDRIIAVERENFDPVKPTCMYALHVHTCFVASVLKNLAITKWSPPFNPKPETLNPEP